MEKSAVEFEVALESFVAGCTKIYCDYMEKNFPSLTKGYLSCERGSKYVRIVMNERSSRSVYCFVDKANGNVLKSATWKAPAKGARGNIYEADNGLTRMTAYGAAYNR